MLSLTKPIQPFEKDAQLDYVFVFAALLVA
jgi:hypothetical protein